MDEVPFEFCSEVLHNLSAHDLKKVGDLCNESLWSRIARLHKERRCELDVFLMHSVDPNAFCCVFLNDADQLFTFAEVCGAANLSYLRVKSITLERKTISRSERKFVVTESAIDGIFAFLASHIDRYPHTFEMVSRFPNFERILTQLIVAGPCFLEVKLRYFPSDSSCCPRFLKSQLTKRVRRLDLFGNWPTSINAEISGFVEKCWWDPSFSLTRLQADKTAIMLSFDLVKPLLTHPRVTTPKRKKFAFCVKVDVPYEKAMNHVREHISDNFYEIIPRRQCRFSPGNSSNSISIWKRKQIVRMSLSNSQTVVM